MRLTMRLGDDDDLEYAQRTVERRHYLHQRVDRRARPMAYMVEWKQMRVALVMVGIPHATRNKNWWGYAGLPTQWQVLDMCRIWIDPDFQRGGCMCSPDNVPGYMDRHGVFRPTTATWMIQSVLDRVQRDRISLWPPVLLEQPYHIELMISYHDPQYHRGTIYRESHAMPMYTHDGVPVPGPAGKFGWCWKLSPPNFEWNDLTVKARTLRMF